MQNIETILNNAGIELTDEQKESVNKAVAENYKTVAEYEKQKAKIETLDATVKETKDALAKFDGVDAEALNSKIKELEDTIAKNDKAYKSKIAERDFDELLKDAITDAKGVNVKAIKALLDVDTLRASTNQKADVTEALKALAEAEDSKMLFMSAEPDKVGSGSPIGSFKGASTGLSGVEKAFYERTGIKLD